MEFTEWKNWNFTFWCSWTWNSWRRHQRTWFNDLQSSRCQSSAMGMRNEWTTFNQSSHLFWKGNAQNEFLGKWCIHKSLETQDWKWQIEIGKWKWLSLSISKKRNDAKLTAFQIQNQNWRHCGGIQVKIKSEKKIVDEKINFWEFWSCFSWKFSFKNVHVSPPIIFTTAATVEFHLKMCACHCQ